MKHEVISIRCTKEQKDVIQKAALKDCRSVNSFCLLKLLEVIKK